MNKSENIKNLAAALARFQAEIQNPKNTADNPYYKSKYAPLQDVLNIARPLLAKHGLSVLQIPGGDGEHISVTTLLMHDSGEWIESDPLILKTDKPTAQGAGSAITYGRRYCLSAVLGISSEDDDDGNSASGKNGKPEKSLENKDKPEVGEPKTQSPEVAPQQPELEKGKIQRLQILRRQKGVSDEKHQEFLKKLGVGSSKYLSEEQYQRYIDYLNKLPDAKGEEKSA